MVFMSESGSGPFRAFIVHAYADRRANRLLVAGRLEDGRSFAAAVGREGDSLLVFDSDAEAFASALAAASLPCEAAPSLLRPFERSGTLVRFSFPSMEFRSRAAAVLKELGLRSPDADLKSADAYLLSRGIRGPAAVSGPSRPGRGVDLVFPEPELLPADPTFRAPLRLAAIDIETDEGTRAVRAVSLTLGEKSPFPPVVHLVEPPGRSVRLPGGSEAGGAPPSPIRLHPDEDSLLRSFAADLRTADPDVITGWNVLDFDLSRLAERFEARGIPFAIGRASEPARFLPGSGRGSAAAIVQGRQVFDALRAVRAGGESYSDYTLETVSRAVLGEGKSPVAPVAVDTDPTEGGGPGADRIAALDRLYAEDPASFASYCLRDSELVLRILDATGLFRLAVERAALTGVSIDKAWTSVASFERVYAAGLLSRGIAPACAESARRVSGAAGGTVLESLSGLFSAVAVFDFRSLYPTIIRTFNIDPYAHESVRAGVVPAAEAILAPNGAAFSREGGVLPALIGEYFDARRAALDAGDDIAAHVYKILMNSFYGVLGTPTCRYARTELAGAITSFARKWLHFSRDWFASRGFRVLYGDTDSVFVETGLPADAEYGAYLDLCGGLASALNAELGERVRAEYGLDSCMQIRFDKAYRRFLIPPLRAVADDDAAAGAAPRGRAKGYAGLLLSADGGQRIEVKGMEAVRSDVTALARDAQLELLARVFRGEGAESVDSYLADVSARLRRGELDASLVYRKRLARPPEEYTASTPPQVRAARALGWTGRRGTVSYVWTSSGPEPVSARKSPLDYDHYIDAQLLPVARSIAAAAGFLIPSAPSLQMDLGL
jgi:DNA polymerase-2